MLRSHASPSVVEIHACSFFIEKVVRKAGTMVGMSVHKEGAATATSLAQAHVWVADMLGGKGSVG